MKRSLWAVLLFGGAGLSALAQTTPDTAPVPEETAPPSAVDDAAPGVVDRVPDLGSEDAVEPPPRPRPGAVPPPDPRRDPIEQQPLPGDPDLSEPLPADRDVFPPAPGRRPRPIVEVAPAAPAPPQPRPQISIEEVVQNPVRIHEARLMVLTGGDCAGATYVLDTLARRFPTDARVSYLRYYSLSRFGQPEQAQIALRQAVALERLYPIVDYDRFMEPLQGPDRYYVERVRRAALELAAVDSLVEPVPAEVLPVQPSPLPPDRAATPRRSRPLPPGPPSERRRPEAEPVEPAPLPTEPAPDAPVDPVPDAPADPLPDAAPESASPEGAPDA